MHTLLTNTFCLMCHMQELLLINNKIGNPGLTALADAVGKGALPQLQELYLGGNSIGDVGLSALADVVSRGAPWTTRGEARALSAKGGGEAWPELAGRRGRGMDTPQL